MIPYFFGESPEELYNNQLIRKLVTKWDKSQNSKYKLGFKTADRTTCLISGLKYIFDRR